MFDHSPGGRRHVALAVVPGSFSSDQGNPKSDLSRARDFFRRIVLLGSVSGAIFGGFAGPEPLSRTSRQCVRGGGLSFFGATAGGQSHSGRLAATRGRHFDRRGFVFGGRDLVYVPGYSDV